MEKQINLTVQHQGESYLVCVTMQFSRGKVFAYDITRVDSEHEEDCQWEGHPTLAPIVRDAVDYIIFVVTEPACGNKIACNGAECENCEKWEDLYESNLAKQTRVLAQIDQILLMAENIKKCLGEK